MYTHSSPPGKIDGAHAPFGTSSPSTFPCGYYIQISIQWSYVCIYIYIYCWHSTSQMRYPLYLTFLDYDYIVMCTYIYRSIVYIYNPPHLGVEIPHIQGTWDPRSRPKIGVGNGWKILRHNFFLGDTWRIFIYSMYSYKIVWFNWFGSNFKLIWLKKCRRISMEKRFEMVSLKNQKQSMISLLFLLVSGLSESLSPHTTFL